MPTFTCIPIFGIKLNCCFFKPGKNVYHGTTVLNIVNFYCNLGSMYLLVLLFKYISHPYCYIREKLVSRFPLAKGHVNVYQRIPLSFAFLPGLFLLFFFVRLRTASTFNELYRCKALSAVHNAMGAIAAMKT